jgi:hypothetical protein
MRFLTTFLFASSAIAATIVEKRATKVERDLPTITGAFNSIGSAVVILDNSVKALVPNGDVASEIADLTDKSNGVISAINTATTTVSGTSAVSLIDALTLVSASNTLVNQVQNTVNDLISAKSIIDAANEDQFVLDQLNAIKTAANSFIAAVVSKVPTIAQSIAQTQAEKVVTALNQGITAYGGST